MIPQIAETNIVTPKKNKNHIRAGTVRVKKGQYTTNTPEDTMMHSNSPNDKGWEHPRFSGASGELKPADVFCWGVGSESDRTYELHGESHVSGLGLKLVIEI